MKYKIIQHTASNSATDLSVALQFPWVKSIYVKLEIVIINNSPKLKQPIKDHVINADLELMVAKSTIYALIMQN